MGNLQKQFCFYSSLFLFGTVLSSLEAMRLVFELQRSLPSNFHIIVAICGLCSQWLWIILFCCSWKCCVPRVQNTSRLKSYQLDLARNDVPDFLQNQSNDAAWKTKHQGPISVASLMQNFASPETWQAISQQCTQQVLTQSKQIRAGSGATGTLSPETQEKAWFGSSFGSFRSSSLPPHETLVFRPPLLQQHEASMPMAAEPQG